MSNGSINYYVKNKDLMIEIQKLKDTNVFPEKLGMYIMQIVDGLSHRPNFNGYTYLDEMKSEALLAVVKGIRNFDPYKYNNPFAYITQIAWNAFIAYINKEKTKSKTKNRLFDLKEKIEDEYGENMLQAIDYSPLACVIINEDCEEVVIEIESFEFEEEDND